MIKKSEFKKAKIFSIKDGLEYLPNSVVIKSIVWKNTGEVRAISFDSGEVLIGKTSPFDTLLQIIEGNAEIIIDEQSNLLENGECIIIPAHANNIIKANVRFKMLSVIIKSGYDEISI